MFCSRLGATCFISWQLFLRITGACRGSCLYCIFARSIRGAPKLLTALSNVALSGKSRRRAQSTSATTSGMCLVSNSLPKGIQTIAFFASLNGDIWLSYASNNGVKVKLGSVMPETSSHWKLSIDHNAGASFQSAIENECNTNSRGNISDDSSERSLLPLSDFQKWMTFPRMISPPVFL